VATAVYSHLLIAANGVGLDAEYYVPAGYVVVVRDVSVLLYGTPDDTAFGLLDVNTGTYLYYRLFLDPSEFDHVEMRQVLPAGATLAAQSSGPNNLSARVSGYLLTA
jgi:hypothetical protein